jgi:hypothetical protein
MAEIGGDSANDCDAKNLLLKKNFSWTHSATLSGNYNSHVNSLNVLTHSKSFRSKSNPHVVLDGSGATNLRASLQHLISNRFNYNNTSANSNSGGIVRSCNKLAPLAKAISFTSMSTNNQTLSTPTAAIQLSAHHQRPPSSILSFNKFILHCKVNRKSLSLASHV